MAGNKLIFKNAEEARNAIMASQKKEIANLYEDWADEIGERAKYYSHKSTASAPVSERYYRELQKQLRQTSQEVSNEVYKKIKSNIYTVADAVVSDNVKWLESFGFSSDGLNAAFSYVPHEIVQNLVTGQIYDSGWSLSFRIWGDNEQTLKDIYQVMAKGLAENKPIYEIAKDLESYVRPSAKLPWNLRMADGKKIYKKQVDYNAQRLARTLVQHGYQQSFIATTQKNPFITEYVWRSNGSRVCDLCKARDGVHYKKTELPMDHPNGMCTMEPVVADDMADQLADWFNSPDGTYPDIDEFAKQFGYESSIKESVKSNQPANTHYIVQGKDISATWERRPDQFDFEIEDVINAQGFDGKPRVVSAEEFDEAVKKSNFVAQRTYSAPDQETLDAYRDQLYNGKWYVDCSAGGAQYGQGMYCAADYTGTLTDGIKAEMKHYKSLYTIDLRDESMPIKGRLNLAIDYAKSNGISNEKELKYIEAWLNKDKGLVKELNLSEEQRDKMNELLRFANIEKPSYTETMTLDPSAKIIKYDDLHDIKYHAYDHYINKEIDRLRSDGTSENMLYYIADRIGVDKNDNFRDSSLEWYHNKKDEVEIANNMIKNMRNRAKEYDEKMRSNFDDLGSFAAAQGYDAINVEGHGQSGSYTVILNRTKVIFKGE